MSDDLIDRVANDLASGRAVDWAAAIAEASSAGEREQLESLRQLQGIIRGDLPASPAVGGPDSDSQITLPGTTTVGSKAATSANKQWGRYRLVEEVGAGSYGSVYRAFDSFLDLDIAIKILHRHVGDDLLRERLLSEGRALAKVRHQNVVRVLGVELSGDRVGLCTEFIHGETLEHEVRTRGTFSQSQAVEVGEAICLALSAVHRAGFVHRDVKARNIMRERDTGRIVLMDFGTGRDLKQELALTTIRIDGTAIYMAPEVLSGQPASHSSDAYSVGVVLYYVLTAAYPVEGGSIEDLRAAHSDGLHTPLGDRRPDLTPSFLHVVERALATKQKRYATPGALLEDLEKISTDRRPLWLKRLTMSATMVAAALAGLIGLGFVSTTYLNKVLGRADFVNEGVLDWLKWGARSTLSPIAIAAFWLLVITLLLECNRLLTRISTKARDIERMADVWIHRWTLDDVTVLSSVALLVSAIAVFGTIWYFKPLLETLVFISPDISTVSLERLTLLSPDFANYQLSYRKAFLTTTIACALVWYPAVRLAIRTRQQMPRRAAVAGAGVLILSLVLLDFPYLLLSHDIDFKEVSWNGRVCHLLGQRADDRLIFCGDLPPPRSRTVRADLLAPHVEPVHDSDPLPGTYEAKKKWSIFKFMLNKPDRRPGE